MLRVPAPGPRRHTQCRSPPHTLLQLLRHPPLTACEELPPPAALARQRRGADLGASGVPQVMHGVHLESQVVVRVHHLVRQRVFHVAPVAHLVGADQDAVIRIKATALLVVAFLADDVRGGYGGAAVGGPEQGDVVRQEADDGAVGEEPVAVFFGARDVAVFVKGVFDAEVGGALGGSGGAGEDGEEGGPGVVG